MSRHAPTRVREKGKKVTNIIQSKPFWKGVQNVLNVVEPLVRVLRAVDEERRSEMGHFFNPQYMYRTDGRNENYDNASEVLIGEKNIIKRMLDNEDRATIACKQMHDYRLQLYYFGTSTAQRAAQILSPGELDDVHLLPEFETPPTPKRQKKTVGARGRSKKHGISIADLETIKENVDDETPESSDNVVYQTSNDSTSKTSNQKKSRFINESKEYMKKAAREGQTRPSFLCRCLLAASAVAGLHSPSICRSSSSWVNLIMDTLGVLALVTEKPTEELLKKSHVGRTAPLITRIMWRNLLAQVAFQISVLLVFQFRGESIFAATMTTI
ncbi:hypothetical protein Taro_046375 [Colocasia esculenta]|uniref:Cation-transporting P-type ATPase C-terminal domain-containing protein n=1 Tax=Colocasia esculenta TaxID=4460 RepID=A0A843WPR2_COLES|nr:hypothetical protein [Colocasia esculenta]